jgi:predicted N-acetyltransferase YhbS
VGDAPYYGRFGFARESVEALSLPGPVALERFLGLELKAGALKGAQGVIAASGRMIPADDEIAARQTA